MNGDPSGDVGSHPLGGADSSSSSSSSSSSFTTVAAVKKAGGGGGRRRDEEKDELRISTRGPAADDEPGLIEGLSCLEKPPETVPLFPVSELAISLPIVKDSSPDVVNRADSSEKERRVKWPFEVFARANPQRVGLNH